MVHVRAGYEASSIKPRMSRETKCKTFIKVVIADERRSLL